MQKIHVKYKKELQNSIIKKIEKQKVRGALKIIDELIDVVNLIWDKNEIPPDRVYCLYSIIVNIHNCHDVKRLQIAETFINSLINHKPKTKCS